MKSKTYLKLQEKISNAKNREELRALKPLMDKIPEGPEKNWLSSYSAMVWMGLSEGSSDNS
jgi:hypothetical protein